MAPNKDSSPKVHVQQAFDAFACSFRGSKRGEIFGALRKESTRTGNSFSPVQLLGKKKGIQAHHRTKKHSPTFSCIHVSRPSSLASSTDEIQPLKRDSSESPNSTLSWPTTNNSLLQNLEQLIINLDPN